MTLKATKTRTPFHPGDIVKVNPCLGRKGKNRWVARAIVAGHSRGPMVFPAQGTQFSPKIVLVRITGAGKKGWTGSAGQLRPMVTYYFGVSVGESLAIARIVIRAIPVAERTPTEREIFSQACQREKEALCAEREKVAQETQKREEKREHSRDRTKKAKIEAQKAAVCKECGEQIPPECFECRYQGKWGRSVYNCPKCCKYTPYGATPTIGDQKCKLVELGVISRKPNGSTRKGDDFVTYFSEIGRSPREIGRVPIWKVRK